MATDHDSERERSEPPEAANVIADLRGALTSEPDVKAAVMFGSTARGDSGPDSDVDVLVWLRRRDLRTRRQLRDRLEAAVGRAVQIVDAEEADERASLLEAVLRDGLVVVDHGNRWAELQRRSDDIGRRAAQERVVLEGKLAEAERYFEERMPN